MLRLDWYTRYLKSNLVSNTQPKHYIYKNVSWYEKQEEKCHENGGHEKKKVLRKEGTAREETHDEDEDEREINTTCSRRKKN